MKRTQKDRGYGFWKAIDYPQEEMKYARSCEECNDKGWIDTYNTNTNVQEIQRCDECKVFTSDDKAKQFKNK